MAVALNSGLLLVNFVGFYLPRLLLWQYFLSHSYFSFFLVFLFLFVLLVVTLVFGVRELVRSVDYLERLTIADCQPSSSNKSAMLFHFSTDLAICVLYVLALHGRNHGCVCHCWCCGTFAVILPLVMRFQPTGMIPGAFPTIPGGMPEISGIIAAVGNTVGVWLGVITLAGLVFLSTVFWVQSAAVDDVGALRALGRSISFVKNNFKTTLGIAAFYVIAAGFARAIFQEVGEAERAGVTASA